MFLWQGRHLGAVLCVAPGRSSLSGAKPSYQSSHNTQSTLRSCDGLPESKPKVTDDLNAKKCQGRMVKEGTPQSLFGLEIEMIAPLLRSLPDFHQILSCKAVSKAIWYLLARLHTSSQHRAGVQHAISNSKHVIKTVLLPPKVTCFFPVVAVYSQNSGRQNQGYPN